MFRIRTAAAFLACALVVPAQQAQAQRAVRLVAGPTISTISTDEWDTSSKVGIFVAAGTSFDVSEGITVSPYLGFIQKGTTFSDDTDGSYNYIEFPVLFGKSIPVGEKASLGLSLGPQVAFMISCDEDGFDCKEYDDFKGTEFGIVGGAGIGFPLSEPYSLSFGISYDLGLTDLFDTDSGYKNRVIYLWGSIGTMIGG